MFVEYASEIGRHPPTSIIRHIETASLHFSSSMSEATLDNEEINLMSKATLDNEEIAQSVGSSYLSEPRRVPVSTKVPTTADTDDDDNNKELVGFQQNSLRVTTAEEVDFEACFKAPSTNSITVPLADAIPALPASETTHINDAPDPSCSVDWPKRMIANANSRSQLPTMDRCRACSGGEENISHPTGLLHNSCILGGKDRKEKR
ncbi:hypothetical protein MHU86_22453 [Fragilaria crotonensis]|nr:hypothetical protein MHU86_22453 [Fragilaria crotonensis]